MNLRHKSIARAASVVLAFSSQAIAQSTGDAALDSALAERLALLADDAVAVGETPEPFLRQSAALLDMARQLNPKEIRFARSSASVLLRLGESQRALGALTAVRSLDPKDQLAMIQFIDLSANAMESADARVAYLQQIVDTNGIAAEVRSHAAVSLMELLYQRAEDTRAGQVLDTALALNPQNVAALVMKYRIAAASGSALDRARALNALLEASPLDDGWLTQAARESVGVGDYAGAHSFFELLFSVRVSSGQSPSVDDIINLSSSELLGGNASDVLGLVKQALGSIKDDGRLYAIDLLATQFEGTRIEDQAAAIATARGVYLAQLAGVSQLLNNPEAKEMPATSPAAPFPNVTADAAKLAAGDPAGLKTAYTVALAEQLWFDLYFRAAAVDDASIAALATLLGSDADPLVVRLQGWKLLSAGQAEEARVKLSAVADRDGYAKLGLAAASFTQGKLDEGKATLTEFLAARPTGMLGVYAGVAAKLAEVKAPQTPDEEAVTKALSELRRPIMDLLRNPRSAYLLTATPVNVSFGPGEVLLARVTLQNTGRMPIVVGPGGLIHPLFTVDVQTRGEAARPFPGVATGKWWGAVRLMPNQSISQVVRLDRGAVHGFLRQYPTALITLASSITTNGVTVKNGTLPKAGGQQATVGNVMERRSSPLFVEAYMNKVLDRMANGSPLERLTMLELAATVVPLLDKQADRADAKAAADKLRSALNEQLAKEPVAEIKAWATISRAAAAGGGANVQPDVEATMAIDSPGAKTAVLILARALPTEIRREIAEAVLKATPEGPLAELAAGVREQPEPPAPTTAPAGAPATP